MSAAATAALSQGASAAHLMRWVAATLRQQAGAPDGRFGTLVDVGCGQGDLAAALLGQVGRVIGLDLVRYPGLAAVPDIEFRQTDLNAAFPAESGIADAVVAVETIEHLENPRALLREMARLARPGGLVLVTTPNQLSWLSKLALLAKQQFTAFQEAPGLYPTHITALLAGDLLRIARECGLVGAEIRYSGAGRMPGTSRRYPGWISRRWPRAASDNVMLLARKAEA